MLVPLYVFMLKMGASPATGLEAVGAPYSIAAQDHYVAGAVAADDFVAGGTAQDDFVAGGTAGQGYG